MTVQFTNHLAIKYTPVDCVRALSDCKARLFTKDEYPFIVGRLFDLEDALNQYM